MRVLAESAKTHERRALIEHFYNHIKPKPFIRVTINVRTQYPCI